MGRRNPVLAIAGAAASAALAAAVTVLAADGAPRAPVVAELPAILAAVRAPGAKAVLVNVWATWCDPCREELPVIARFYRQHRAQGLRLVLVSADDEDGGAEVARVLAAAGMPGDTPSFIKHGDDMKFIDGLDRRWSGALPGVVPVRRRRPRTSVVGRAGDGARARKTASLACSRGSFILTQTKTEEREEAKTMTFASTTLRQL